MVAGLPQLGGDNVIKQDISQDFSFLEEEWIELITEAKNIGLTITDVRQFINHSIHEHINKPIVVNR